MTIQRMFRLLLAALLILSFLSGCAISNTFGPYMGKVVDAETKEPIEGAVVFMECSTLTANAGGANTNYIDATEVLTDEKGEFQIELGVITFRPGHLWDYDPYFNIFKPGYGAFPMHPGANVNITIRDSSHIFPANQYVIITLPKLKTRKERVRNLGYIYSPSEIPFDKWKNFFDLRNIENIQLGFRPYRTPK